MNVEVPEFAKYVDKKETAYTITPAPHSLFEMALHIAPFPPRKIELDLVRHGPFDSKLPMPPEWFRKKGVLPYRVSATFDDTEGFYIPDLYAPSHAGQREEKFRLFMDALKRFASIHIFLRRYDGPAPFQSILKDILPELFQRGFTAQHALLDWGEVKSGLIHTTSETTLEYNEHSRRNGLYSGELSLTINRRASTQASLKMQSVWESLKYYAKKTDSESST